jgi:UDP-glucose 4-epimerase
MMRFTRVLVTGGSGRLGRFVVEALRRQTDVTVLDLKPPVQAGVAYVEASIADAAAVGAAVAGHDAVVHLAGYDDGDAPGETGYWDVNLLGAWNVLLAAEAEGIRRVVVASSMAAVGLGRGAPPQYLPVDERHPMRPTDGYAISKQAIEAMGSAFARRGLTVAMLRPTLVVRPEMAPRMVAELNAGGEPQGIAVDAPHYGGLPAFRAWVSSRDCAACFAAALAADFDGYAVAQVAADDSMGGVDTLAHAGRVLGYLPEVRDPRRFEAWPTASALDNGRAARLFGWTPRDRWESIIGLVRDRPWSFAGWTED